MLDEIAASAFWQTPNPKPWNHPQVQSVMLDEIAARAADAEGEINNINLRLGQTLRKAVRIWGL